MWPENASLYQEWVINHAEEETPRDDGVARRLGRAICALVAWVLAILWGEVRNEEEGNEEEHEGRDLEELENWDEEMRLEELRVQQLEEEALQLAQQEQLAQELLDEAWQQWIMEHDTFFRDEGYYSCDERGGLL